MPPSRMRKVVSATLGGSLIVTLLGGGAGTPAAADPDLDPTTVVSGLTIPWDLTWVGDTLLYNERAGRVWSKQGAAPAQAVTLSGGPQIFANGEGGLLGMVAHPAAATNRLFYTCQATGVAPSDPQDVRVQRWRLDTASRAVADQVVVDNLPLTSGRHSGCRMRFGADGKLYVGTGDAAVGVNSQTRSNLGGKVLRVNDDGGIPTDNPFYANGGDARYVWTYGHRNVQGLALRPGTSQLWSAEHGPDRDDEVNLVSRGANYGWDPVPADSDDRPYNEQVPMTDTAKFPSARRAVWSSGEPAVATAGMTFLTGSGWGVLQGMPAVALLKAQGIMILRLRPDGTVGYASRLADGQNQGRIRTVQMGPDGALYYATANGAGTDKIVRIAPTARPRAYAPGLDVSPVGVSAARTGRTVHLFVRSTGDLVYTKQSSDDGVTWSGWSSTGVTSASAPSVTSSAAGRVDLFTRSASGVVHTWFVQGVRSGQTEIAGVVTAAPTGSSVGDGSLDLLVRSSGDRVYRKRYTAGRWSAWRSLGGVATSAVGASANVSTKATTLTVRGSDGTAYERTVTPTSDGGDWTPNRALQLWSARALGDTRTGVGLVGISGGSDGNAVVDRGPLIMGIAAGYDSAPDVVTREDGSWIMFGRASNGSVYSYDARPGRYRNVNLGGVVR